MYLQFQIDLCNFKLMSKSKLFHRSHFRSFSLNLNGLTLDDFIQKMANCSDSGFNSKIQKSKNAGVQLYIQI